MPKLPITDPHPDFDRLEEIILGKRVPERVHFFELVVDPEVIEYVTRHYLKEDFPQLGEGEVKPEPFYRGLVNFYYRMGYDYVPLGLKFNNMPQFKERRTKDSAALSRSERSWVEEAGGIVKNWKDYEEIDWKNIELDMQPLEIITANLPSGMKVAVGTTLFEMIMERFFGYEDLFKFSLRKPHLVEKVFDSWGNRILAAYERLLDRPEVGAVLHMDDLGYKKGTIMKPEFLHTNVFPWFERYSSLAHERNKSYWYHCCGNVREVLEDLIEGVEIDAFHSFQDEIMPVDEFVEQYGDRVAALGGIDVDKLARYEEGALRDYVHEKVNNCMPGRYGLGSGNSVTNYVPPENYLLMLEEGMNWSEVT